MVLGPALAGDSAEMGPGWGMAEPKQGPAPWVEVVCTEAVVLCTLGTVGLEGALRDLTWKSQVKPEALVCSGV